MNIPRNRTRDPDYPRVPLTLAKERIDEWGRNHPGRWPASMIAAVIWPGRKFRNEQGAGAAGSIILRRLGYRWSGDKKTGWGWTV